MGNFTPRNPTGCNYLYMLKSQLSMVGKKYPRKLMINWSRYSEPNVVHEVGYLIENAHLWI